MRKDGQRMCSVLRRRTTLRKICGIRTFFRKLSALISSLAVLAGVFYAGADMAYRNRNRELLTRKQEWLADMLYTEKEWILSNQGADGAFYMNGEKAGNINPYFACLAAIGLLEGIADGKESIVGAADFGDSKLHETETDVQAAVFRYLDWHTALLISTGGEMGSYRKDGETLVRTQDADSVDAYLGVYLELMGRYVQAFPGEVLPENWKTGSLLALEQLERLMPDGVAQVSEENKAQYFMDNVEVWKGLLEFEKGMEAQAARALRQQLQGCIPEVFWNEETQTWRVLAGDDGFDRLDFYPDGIAQVYPLIYGFPEDGAAGGYQRFCEQFSWQSVSDAERPSDFLWTMTGMAAAKTGDWERLETFLKNYQREFALSREYPLYTAEAGWICRECGALYREYERQKAEQLTFEGLKELLHSCAWGVRLCGSFAYEAVQQFFAVVLV